MVHFQAILVFWSFTVTLIKDVQGPMSKCDQNMTTEKRQKNDNLGQKRVDVFSQKSDVFHHFWGEDFTTLGLGQVGHGSLTRSTRMLRFARENKGLANSTRKRILAFASVVNSEPRSNFHQILFVYIILIDDVVSSKYTLHPNPALP